MDDEKINIIKKYESEADEIVEKARIEYQQIISSADEEGLTAFEKSKSEVREQSKKIIEKYQTEGIADGDKIASGYEKSIKAIEGTAAENREKAVVYMLNRIRKQYSV